MTGLLTRDFVMQKMKEFGNVEQVRQNRIRITTPPERIQDAIRTSQILLSCDRLITMSTADNGRTLELFYHLTGPHRTIISIAVELPRDAPVIASASGLLPPAGIYERQIHDLFGIVFSGHPGLQKILLNEDWPEGEYPMRKDWTPGPDTFYGGVRVERI